MMHPYAKKSGLAFVALGLGLSLAACGGGNDDAEDLGPAPSFAGTYDATFTKTGDSCNTGLSRSFSVVQSVSQDGRAVTLVSHQLTLQGSVDADNAGISTSVQQIETGVTVTSTVVYRTTETPGVFGAGLSIVARDRDATCTLSYAGTAKLKG